MKYFSLIILSASLLASCSESYTPKPRGHFRIEFLPKDYSRFSDDCPYSFEKPSYAVAVADSGTNTEPCWKNLEYPYYHATLHLTYKPLTKFRLNELSEESRKYTYEHTIKADEIEEQVIRNDSHRVYGLIYKIAGNTATPLRFYLTDSSNHFIDGALYFNHRTEYDSIAPVQQYLFTDIFKLVETLEWK